MYNNQVMTATHDNVKIVTKTITSYLNYIGGIQSTCTVPVAATVVPLIHSEVWLAMLFTAAIQRRQYFFRICI